MIKLQRITWIAAILSAGITASGWSQGWDTHPVESLQTIQGLVQINEVGDNGYRVWVAGKLLGELEAFGVHIAGILPATGSPQYVLLEMYTGGGSCPYRYRLVDLTPGQKPYWTGDFGNCSVGPIFGMQGENVTIDFSNLSDFKTRTFSYQSGHRCIKSRAGSDSHQTVSAGI